MQMMRARCTACEWIFDVVAIPMPLAKAAKAAQRRACCPMCGTDDRRSILVADPRPLTDEEFTHRKRHMKDL